MFRNALMTSVFGLAMASCVWGRGDEPVKAGDHKADAGSLDGKAIQFKVVPKEASMDLIDASKGKIEAAADKAIDVKVTPKEKAVLDWSRAAEEAKKYFDNNEKHPWLTLLRPEVLSPAVSGGGGDEPGDASGKIFTPLATTRIEVQSDSLRDIKGELTGLSEVMKNSTTEQKLKANELLTLLQAAKNEFDQNQNRVESLQKELADSNHKLKAATDRSLAQSTSLSIGVLAFTSIVIGVLAFLVHKRNLRDQLFFRLSGLTVVVAAGLFVIVAGFDMQQIAPMFGLLGAVAGYIFGKTEPQPSPDGHPKAQLT